MKLATCVSLLLGSAAAFTTNIPSSQPKTQLSETKADLESLAKELNPVVGYFDPLDLGASSFWGCSQEQTIGWLRQAEVKHGRVAMAAFVGYIVQSNGVHFPWAISFDGSPFPSDAGSPPEQWDALPQAAKWQIILFIGFLEWFSESQGTHYMRGGKPGAFPKFSDSDVIPHPVPLNLFDPFGFSAKKTEEQKAVGLIKELNNGRLAMLGIIGFLSEQKLEGSVPLLKGVVSHYDGEPMAPF